MMRGWCKPKQAAKYAGISERTIRDWLKVGLPHSRVGGCVLVKFSDIDTFLGDHRVQDKAIDRIVNEALEGWG